ncbi:DUF397 domain-containing protein [Streptomyces sp. NPDC097640]|uniref:DUF397 domain-containing protein n=1 Tax=Streptomyces sp. NPDC097640 TaxID=3157229 RepID=UPI00331DB591
MSVRDWQKSSFSAEAANCLYVARVPADWRKSPHSAQGSNCINVAAPTPDAIKIRESDDPDIILTTTPATLGVFIRAAKAGQFDHLADSPPTGCQT